MTKLFIKSSLLIIGLYVFPSCSNQESEMKDVIEKAGEQEKKEKPRAPEPIGKGKITTKVDGMDVKNVNLWNMTSSSRTIVCTLSNNQEVNILKDAEPYYLVESTKDNKCKGYCMKGFVNKN